MPNSAGNTEEFEALPDQSGKKAVRSRTTGEKVASEIAQVPNAPQWAERSSFYKKELEAAIGAEFVCADIAEQPFIRANLPKRKRR